MFYIVARALIAVFTSKENEVDPDVFEGDMILTPEQKMAALNGWDVDDPLGRGSVKNRRWPGGVFVYDIDKNIGKRRWLSA